MLALHLFFSSIYLREKGADVVCREPQTLAIISSTLRAISVVDN